MAALFPRWTNTAVRAVMLASAIALAGGAGLAFAAVRSPYATGARDPFEQPVSFDHRHHTRDAGLDCRYCHEGAERSRHAGLPAVSVCMGCHGQVWVGSPALEPVVKAFRGDAPLAWSRVHNLPGFVYFDHASHLAKGVGCESCHGRVDHMARVYATAPLTMEWCLECHRNPSPSLRDPARAFEPGAPLLEPAAAKAQIEALDISPPTHCSGCHR